MYKKAEANLWTTEELDLSKDKTILLPAFSDDIITNKKFDIFLVS